MPADVPDSPSDRLGESMLLLNQAQAGDDVALDRLIGRYYGRVLRIVRLRMGPGLRAHVESGDILQETFAAAIRSLESFEPRDEASLIHWLSRIAENRLRTAWDRLHAAKRDVRRSVSMETLTAGDESQAWEPTARGKGAIDELSDAEWIAVMEDCIHELPERQREAILLRNYSEASWQTVADTLSLASPDAARMCHKRALADLLLRARARGLEGG